MEQLIELLKQIQDLAGVAIDALDGAKKDTEGEKPGGEKPEGERPEGGEPKPGEAGPPAPEGGEPKKEEEGASPFGRR